MKKETVLYHTSRSRVWHVVSFIDGNGALCQEVFDDDETAAETLCEELDGLNATYKVTELNVN